MVMDVDCNLLKYISPGGDPDVDITDDEFMPFTATWEHGDYNYHVDHSVNGANPPANGEVASGDSYPTFGRGDRPVISQQIGTNIRSEQRSRPFQPPADQERGGDNRRSNDPVTFE